MAFNFSANQFEQRFRAPGLSNWEYPRFSPPRPRGLRLNVKPVADNKGHLLPTARRDGNSFGSFRSTYELPLRITRSFCARYDACLSGRYKFRDYPRDLCNCQRENPRARACDIRETLGTKGDPYWDRPKCPTKCENVQQVLDLNERSLRCKRPKCIIPEEEFQKADKPGLSMPKSKVESGKKERKRLRQRNVTAFPKTRKAPANDPSNSKLAKGKGKLQAGSKQSSKQSNKLATKHSGKLSNKKTESKGKKDQNKSNATNKRSKAALKDKDHKDHKKSPNKDQKKDQNTDHKDKDTNIPQDTAIEQPEKIPEEAS